MATRLNGSAKWITLGITAALILATVAGTFALKADKSDVDAVRAEVMRACDRVTAVEKDAAYNKEAIIRVETKVDKIYDLLLERDNQ